MKFNSSPQPSSRISRVRGSIQKDTLHSVISASSRSACSTAQPPASASSEPLRHGKPPPTLKEPRVPTSIEKDTSISVVPASRSTGSASELVTGTISASIRHEKLPPPTLPDPHVPSSKVLTTSGNVNDETSHCFPPQTSNVPHISAEISIHASSEAGVFSQVVPVVPKETILTSSNPPDLPRAHSGFNYSNFNSDRSDRGNFRAHPNPDTQKSQKSQKPRNPNTQPRSEIPINITYQFLPGVTPDSTIDSVTFSQFGTLVSFLNSCKFIRSRQVPRIRNVFIQYMQKVEADSSNLVSWKHFLLLPAVLFSTSPRLQLSRKIQLLENEDWSFFLLKHFEKKVLDRGSPSPPYGKKDDSVWTPQFLKAKSYIEKGELSAAMRTVSSDGKFASPSENVVEQLQKKHPIASTLGFTDEEIDDLKSCEIDPDELVSTSPAEVADIIRSARKMVSHGIDMLRMEHLQALLGSSVNASPQENEFIRLLTHIVNLLLSAKVPKHVLPAIRDTHLCALPKSQDDVRPIGMGGVLRKIASKVCFLRALSTTKSLFGEVQLALVKGGTEFIVHSFQRSFDDSYDNGSLDIFAMDGDNSFNRASRWKALSEIREKCPSVFPFIRSMYADPSHGFYFGMPDCIRSIKSEEGFHQGDVLATWSYVMTIQPMLEEISRRVQIDFPDRFYMMKFFVDDGNIAAPTDMMVAIVQIIQEIGPLYGFHIKRNKGRYLLGRTGSTSAALEKKDMLVHTLHLDPSIFVPHPLDSSLSSSTSSTSASSAVADDPVLRSETHLYGLKILGSYVGHPDYVLKGIEEYEKELDAVYQKLTKYPDLQGRWLLYKFCFTHKPMYMFRTLSPFLTSSLQDFMVRTAVDMVGGLTNYEFEYQRDWKAHGTFDLPIDRGGLGLPLATYVANAAYVSSFVAFSQSFMGEEHQTREAVLYDDLDEHQVPQIQGFISAAMHIRIPKPKDDPSDWSMQDQLRYILEMTNGSRDSMQSRLTEIYADRHAQHFEKRLAADRIRHTWHVSLCNDSAGKWLDSIPKYATFRMDNANFQAALRFRLQLPAFQIPLGKTCNSCNRNVPIDTCGHHLANGCKVGGHRQQTHDAVKFELNSILRYCGLSTVVEERNLFRDSEKRPDISVHTPIFHDHKKLLIDVSIASPINGSESGKLTVPGPPVPFRNAEARWKSKMTLYGRAGVPQGFDVLPFIFESSGALHPAAVAFLKNLAKYAEAQRSISRTVLYTFFIKRLSCVLTDKIAESIRRRTNNLDKRGTVEDYDVSFIDTNVLEFNKIR